MFTTLKNESPFGIGNIAKVVVNGSQDYYGACSLEKFSSASPLSLTHEDAEGWLDYPTQFRPANFWFKDEAVKVWAYEEAFDNWQDTYGADAVLAFYHSGHGNMDSNGVFQLPLGGKWDNRDWAFSNNMGFGNEQARYQFWSTCLSLRVLGGHDPIRTWHNANKGLRMIFGYETTSVDDANYGKFFWEEWKKNKSFSQAFLDASWRISNGQAPSVCAMGKTPQEANNRLYNERIFSWEAASRDYYHWRWFYARSVSESLRETETQLNIPDKAKIAILGTENAESTLKRLTSALGYGKKTADNAIVDKEGNYYLRDKHSNLFVGKDGRFDARLAKPNTENQNQIDTKKAQKIAEEILSNHNLNQGVTLKLDNIRYENACTGNTVGSGEIGKAHIIGTTFEFRQFIDGKKVINGDNGVVRVSVDNDGTITDIHNSTREVIDLSTKPRMSVNKEPKEPNQTESKGYKAATDDLEAAFNVQLERFVKTKTNGMKSSDNKALKTNIKQSEIGYDVSKDYGKVVARRIYEVDMGDNFQKLYKVQVPIID